MNIAVKHNNVTITSRVISYERSHRICTGIGTLDIVLEGTYSTAINPHDTIDIWENGSFQVKYYVSDVSDSVPDGTITVQCQDKSKYLVDYFIPDQYTIEYPSYTRYWIEKFLTEAQISYSFQTTSQGNLLSNYTALGLQPAYDQIMLLLQLSGWYMYFDGNGVAIIGSLNIDLAQTAGSFGKTDILDIKRISNDKMLRNRALIWGQYDIFKQEYAFADVTKHTPWNYDKKDIRTMVVSNQNIPNKSSAYNIANILLKEFARITIEKHITLWGAKNFNLGNALRINTRTWKGKGLITTFGVSMGRDGLVTNIILDERCPRLFGFFNFGDWVYVGTFGNGIWRKHIKFDPAWYNFSSGLTNLNITDLHINNGIFGSVGYSGQMYYTNTEDGPWYQIPTITGLLSSSKDQITVGSGITLENFSGIMARAVIIDHSDNTVKFGVDNWSGLNTGDYFLTYSGLMTVASGIVSSGVVTSSGNRGWIVEYDPYTGEMLIDATHSGYYPISYSGNYNIQVLDLENDGINDYVSVKSNGSVEIEHTDFGYNFGKHESQFSNYTQDSNTKVAFGSLAEFDGVAGKSISGNQTSVAKPVVFDNESINEREIVWRRSGTFERLKITKAPLASSTLTSPTTSPALTGTVAIVKLSPDNYRAYGIVNSGFTYTVKYLDWNAGNNTCGAVTDLISLAIPDNPYHNPTYEHIWESNGIVVNGVLYFVINHEIRDSSPSLGDPDWNLKADNYTEFYLIKVNLLAGTGSAGLVATFTFPTSIDDLNGERWTIQNLTNQVSIFQAGQNASAFILLQSSLSNDGYLKTNYLLHSYNCENFSITEIQNIDHAGDTGFLYSTSDFQDSQLTGERFFKYYKAVTNNTTYLYNGDLVQITNLSSIPWNYQANNIYAMFGLHDTRFIARNGTDWYFCNPQTLAPEEQLIPPVGYTIIKPYSTSDSSSAKYYWQAGVDDEPGQEAILQTTQNTMLSKCHMNIVGSQTGRGFICGNFFIDYKDPGNSTATLNWIYLDNILNVPRIQGTSFLVLQREGTNFNLLREAGKPIRIDISNNSPVLTVLDTENTFISDFVFGQEVTRVTVASGGTLIVGGSLSQREVRDYRYTLLETTASGTIVASGAGVKSQILYVTQSGIYYGDASTYSGGFLILDSVVSSGRLERIETTNYVYPGQFIFVTTSGENPMFYQRNNDGLVFTSYSGLPAGSRATIIRVDDRL